MNRVVPYIQALMRISNLDVYQARILVYYAITTWNDNPRVKPLLGLGGESGTVRTLSWSK